MKYVKNLGLLAVTATVLLAFASSASATTLTSPTGTVLPIGSTIKATSEGTTYFTGAFSPVSCTHSEMSGTLNSQGSGKTAKVGLSTLDFFACNYTVTVLADGELEIHWKAGGEGTVTSIGAVIDVHTSVGRCRLATGTGVDVGVLTDSHKTGDKTATLHIDNSKIPITEGSFFCGSSVEWEGSYVVTNPDKLYIDQN